MKSGMTFQERAILAAELLSKQSPVTLEKVREQILRVKAKGIRGKKKMAK